jgi:hypothetical protein
MIAIVKMKIEVAVRVTYTLSSGVATLVFRISHTEDCASFINYCKCETICFQWVGPQFACHFYPDTASYLAIAPGRKDSHDLLVWSDLKKNILDWRSHMYCTIWFLGYYGTLHINKVLCIA